MLKALLKKQFLESVAFLFSGKDGKRRSKGKLLAFSALMLYAFGAIGFMFWLMADTLCASLVQAGMAWVYFALMGTIATGFGIIGGVFMAKNKLYEAKDNDLLLSMPIPAWMVIFSRISSLYALTFLFEGLVFVPTLVCYFTVAGFALPAFLCSLTVLLILPLGALAVCVTLGWLIAFVSSKLPVKNLVEIAFAVGFLVAYFALYSKINEYLSYVIAHGEAVGRVMKTALYPFSQLGLACAGDGVALLLFALMFVGVFGLVYLLISLTYLRLATANRGSLKAKYKGKGYKGRSVFSALLRKECARYFKSPMVALNSFLGSVFLLLLPIVALFDLELFQQFFVEVGADAALLLGTVLCVVAATNMITATSVSLEGESIGILRSFPVKTEKILYTKIAFHILLTGVPALFSGVLLCILFKMNFALSAVTVLAVLLFIAFCAVGGLFINLKLPNVHWTNEVAVVKQSASSMLSMFGAWGAVGLLVGGYFLFGKYLPAWGYLLILSAVLALSCGVLWLWIRKKGVEIFESL